MTLERRLVKLEARRAVNDGDAGAREQLAALLARTEAAVLATGDASHRTDASPVENLLRDCLRGEMHLADGLRDFLARRDAQ